MSKARRYKQELARKLKKQLNKRGAGAAPPQAAPARAQATTGRNDSAARSVKRARVSGIDAPDQAPVTTATTAMGIATAAVAVLGAVPLSAGRTAVAAAVATADLTPPPSIPSAAVPRAAAALAALALPPKPTPTTVKVVAPTPPALAATTPVATPTLTPQQPTTKAKAPPAESA